MTRLRDLAFYTSPENIYRYCYRCIVGTYTFGDKIMFDVYVLTLEQGKYYVGKSNNVQKRYREHLTGYKSSYWTRKYKPTGIERVYSDCDPLDEDKITVEYMMLHGINNVRGGPFVSIKLSQETKDHIQQRIRMATDLCVKCGSSSHFVMECDSTGPSVPVAVYPDNSQGSPRCKSCSSEHHFTEDCDS